MKKALFIISVISIGLSLFLNRINFSFFTASNSKTNSNSCDTTQGNQGLSKPIRIGYFHGSRFYPFFRAFKNNYFEEKGIKVELFKNLEIDRSLVRVGEKRLKDNSLNRSPSDARVLSGIEFVDEIAKGNLEGACLGSVSFIYAIQKNIPILAVANLTHSDPNRPSGGIVMRKDIRIDSIEDLKGKRIGISRRSESGIDLFLRVFLKNLGLKNDEIEIVDLSSFFENLRFSKVHGVSSIDKVYDLLNSGEVDGYFFRHYLLIKKAITDGYAYLYRKFDWPESRLAFSVLVFRKDFADTHFNDLKKLVSAYEESLKGKREDISEMDKEIIEEFRFQMESEFMGMGPPVADNPPVVRQDLLNELQNLMFEHGFIKNKVNIEDYVDERFVD